MPRQLGDKWSRVQGVHTEFTGFCCSPQKCDRTAVLLARDIGIDPVLSSKSIWTPALFLSESTAANEIGGCITNAHGQTTVKKCVT